MAARYRWVLGGVAALFVAGCGEPVRPAVADGLALSMRPGFVFPEGCCYYQGSVVRTVVPPAAAPQEGRDNFYAVMGGVPAQKGIVAVAPGDVDYHGGKWRFHAVTFIATPVLLTSEAAVLAAEAAGEVTVTRIAENDFKCPIQP